MQELDLRLGPEENWDRYDHQERAAFLLKYRSFDPEREKQYLLHAGERLEVAKKISSKSEYREFLNPDVQRYLHACEAADPWKKLEVAEQKGEQLRSEALDLNRSSATFSAQLPDASTICG